MGTYVAEIAGKDSIAAIHLFIRRNRSAVIIPSIVYTRTEYGGFDSYFKSLDFLREFAQKYDVTMREVHELNDEKLWNILCIKYQYQIYNKFHFYTPCIMCHLFTHLVRISLYHKCGADAMITGERFWHNGVQKINQHPITIDCFNKILSYAGVNLERPLAMIEDTEIINLEIGEASVIMHANDTKCILSGNLNGYSMNEYDLKVFMNDFVEPIGIYVVKCLKKDQLIAYDELDLFVKGLF